MVATIKTFVDGDNLTDTELNSYLMRQTVIVCDNQTDRDSILTPTEGLCVYRKDLDIIQIYLGSEWRDVDHQKIATRAASQTTTSTSYVDLATSGPSVSFTVPASGKVKITLSTRIANSVAGNRSFVGLTLSGANTRAAADANEETITYRAADNGFWTITHVSYLTGLTPGATTFLAKYRVDGGTGTFQNTQLGIKSIA